MSPAKVTDVASGRSHVSVAHCFGYDHVTSASHVIELARISAAAEHAG